TTTRIRELVQRKFGKRACLWQIRVGQSLAAGKDVVGVAATGAGKTMTFYIRLLMALEDGEGDRMMIIVTPLNILGKQNSHSDRVKNLDYRVIIVNPELLLKENGQFGKLWNDGKFTQNLLYIVFDEAHCVSTWKAFRTEYGHAGDLRFLISKPIPVYAASATLPPPILHDVTRLL
ncbi:P-loop containing nucleoside triphosphate hydrolase protein, partial [Punctularia strigosozonata HHB-11173 SS5]|uniref:P-loop containing nucleoside triphosphate hydrolase protein n=1 Tax=Punctularia strigosozonata (strain HHB-11173) TaxID=741275 RepID=UPI00044170A0